MAKATVNRTVKVNLELDEQEAKFLYGLVCEVYGTNDDLNEIHARLYNTLIDSGIRGYFVNPNDAAAALNINLTGRELQ